MRKRVCMGVRNSLLLGRRERGRANVPWPIQGVPAAAWAEAGRVVRCPPGGRLAGLPMYEVVVASLTEVCSSEMKPTTMYSNVSANTEYLDSTTRAATAMGRRRRTCGNLLSQHARRAARPGCSGTALLYHGCSGTA